MENLNGKIVTVFGGSGFVGRYIVKNLAEAGYTVRIISRSAEDAKPLKSCGFVGQVVHVRGNITDYDKLSGFIKNSYAVVNCVGILYECKKQRFDAIHAQAPEKLAKAAKSAGVAKFVHISAIVSADSKSKYARSKIKGEKAVLAAFPAASILRPSVVFGAEDNFFNQFAAMATISPILPLIGGGKTMFQPVYVGDIALAVQKCVEGNFHGTYDLGGPRKISFERIMKRILRYTHKKRRLLNIPYPAANIIASLTPASVLTNDQLKLLRHSNVVGVNSKTLVDLGIRPTAISAIVPSYLERFIKPKIRARLKRIA